MKEQSDRGPSHTVCCLSSRRVGVEQWSAARLVVSVLKSVSDSVRRSITRMSFAHTEETGLSPSVAYLSKSVDKVS